MTPTLARKPEHGLRGASLALTLAAALVATFAASSAFAQAPAQAPAGTPIPDAALTPEELEKLVARIALYPDDLVALILPASTNPLQIVQADRFLAKRKTDPKAPLDDKWDDSVKSLVNYPEVVTAMSNDLDWTAALGEAVVADQGEVLEAVQAFRRKTQSAGNLKSDPKQTVVVEKEVIKIVPADPQVIYVPQYNPATVVVSGGYSSYGYYPSPYPVYYYPYPPGAALATGLIWGAAIGAAWNGGHWGANYGGGNNNINIDRSTNINTGNIGSGNRPTQSSGNRQGGSSSQWKSNKQPGQVSKSVGATPSARTGDRSGGGGGASRAGPSASPSTRGGGGAGGGGGGVGGASTSRAGASASPSTRDGGGGGGGAFDGYSSGRQTQMDSSRGASSRSSASAGASSRSSAGASSMSSRGGGGGAARGGGGGRGGGGRR